MKKLISLLTLCFVFASCENENVVEEQACDNGTFIGHVVLRTQQEVDDFGALCYTKIDGTLAISDVNEDSDYVVDLSSLSGLTEVFSETYSDSLSGSLYLETKNLTSLNGLQNVTSVGRLRILNNESLINLNGLEGLLSVDGLNSGYSLLQIQNNQSLRTLEGLDNLQVVGRSGYLTIFKITYNPELINFDGLNSLSKVGNTERPGDFNFPTLQIYANSQLQNIDGLENLLEVHGPLRFIFVNDLPFFIAGNIDLNDWCGLQNLFVNGIHGHLTNTAASFDGVEYEGFAPTVQDIIDGNCAQ